MKRITIMLLALIMFLGVIPTINAKETHYRIFVDGKVIALQPGPRIEGGSLMLPVVPLLKQLGYTVALDSNVPERVKISNSINSITFVIGSKNIYINGKEIRMPISSHSYNGVTYLPLRSISQALGKTFGSNPTEQYAWLGVAPTRNKNLPPELQGKDFRNAVWDMTTLQVKKTETLPLSNTVTELYDDGDITYYTYLDYKGKYMGYKATYTYVLAGKNKTNAKLYHGMILFHEKFSNMQDYIDRYFEISSKMEAVYGPPVETDRPKGMDKNNWAEELSLGNLYLTDYYNVGRNSYYIRLYKAENEEFPQLDVLVFERDLNLFP